MATPPGTPPPSAPGDALATPSNPAPPSSASPTPRTPDSVGRRRAALLERGDVFRAYRTALELRRLRGALLAGFYALPAGGGERWHALLFVPPAAEAPSPYAGAVFRLLFALPDEGPIAASVLSMPFFHPLADPGSGRVHVPPRLLPEGAAHLDDLGRVLRRAFSDDFLEQLEEGDLPEGEGNPDALRMWKEDRETFRLLARQTADQSGSEEALYDSEFAEGELRIRRVRWTDREVGEAMDRLRLAFLRDAPPQTSPARTRTILSSIQPKFGRRAGSKIVLEDEDDSLAGDIIEAGRQMTRMGQQVGREVMRFFS
ncbi:hypothetical protein DFJ74DRAFT_734456 [Hyaloraphidium curvatum]|nr:hypothetical protein DFJ74DRAFT_734456 [Hyaloraphidium curvatum]